MAKSSTREGGAIMVGSKGKVIHDTYGLQSRLLPDSLHKSVGDPPQTLRAHHDQP